jgi:phosphoribosylaminoimidazolecarboxamide formyltransferase/IMP cyclohydrolase
MPTALISVTDKSKLADFAKKLAGLGYEIISTGGTYKELEQSKIKNLKKIEEITGFPEIMDGRVKTLHPKIFGGILADRNKAGHLEQAKTNQIPLIDLVVCNLYNFSQKPGIENIDIGGVTLLRAAAKNYEHVTVVCDVDDYEKVLDKLAKNEDLRSFRKEMAAKAFNLTAAYDRMIADYLAGTECLHLDFEKVYDLRYGENPHQQAKFYKELRIKNNELSGVAEAEILHGKQLSYNNILDADSALNLISEFDAPTAAVLKHTNPCGVATDPDINLAFKKAYAADSLSAFGGVIVLNRICTLPIAEEINKVFAEIVLAPDFEAEALKVLKQKKNIRLLKFNNIQHSKHNFQIKDYRKIIGGILEQDYDNSRLEEKDLKFVTKIKPSEAEIKDLLFAEAVVKHVKSNAVVFAKDGVTLGIGAGQMSRVDAMELAIKKAGRAEKLRGAVAASDGFFPFRDSIDKLADFAIKSIIQPGGSIRDKEVIEAADELGISMVFTAIRAFKH